MLIWKFNKVPESLEQPTKARHSYKYMRIYIYRIIARYRFESYRFISSYSPSCSTSVTNRSDHSHFRRILPFIAAERGFTSPEDLKGCATKAQDLKDSSFDLNFKINFSNYSCDLDMVESRLGLGRKSALLLWLWEEGRIRADKARRTRSPSTPPILTSEFVIADLRALRRFCE